jgi:flagellin
LGIKLNINDTATGTINTGYMEDGTYDGANPPEVSGKNWTGDNIREYIAALDTAIDTIAQNRSQLGAYENRLASVSNNLASMNENYERSKSQIMDADMAEESAAMVKYQVLQQTSSAMLAQANQIPSIALQLLGQ